MADATEIRDQNDVRVTVSAAAAVGEVWQMKDGRAAVLVGNNAASNGDRRSFKSANQWTLTKASGFAALDGGRAYWDHSANAVSYKKVHDRDFYLGRFVGDAAFADTTCAVNLNVDPPYDVDLLRDGFNSVVVGTPAAGGLGYPVNLGGSLIFELTATNEAQKVDALSLHGFAKGANAIVEGAFRVLSDGAGTATDVSLGVADATHASDADAIADSVFVHLDGNNVNVNLESDDGTTEVAATDSTIDYTEGSTVSERVEFWIDMRNPADVQVYLQGANVLPATVFNVDAYAGTWLLLCHVEKTATTDTYKLAIDWLRARFSEQNASS